MMPGCPILKSKWIELCRGNKTEKAPVYSRVCSQHFSSSCYQRDLQHELLGLPLRKKLKPDAVPNRNLPQTKKALKKNDNAIIHYIEPLQNSKRTLISIVDTNDKNEIKIPMRSSIRIAKRKSLELLTNFTSSNAKKRKLKETERDKIIEKIKFMNILNLKFGRNENAGQIIVSLADCEFEIVAGNQGNRNEDEDTT